MTLVVDPANDTFNLSDDYEFTGNAANAERLKFTAQNYDEDNDLLNDTVAIMMLNSTTEVADGAFMYYKVKTKS